MRKDRVLLLIETNASNDIFSNDWKDNGYCFSTIFKKIRNIVRENISIANEKYAKKRHWQLDINILAYQEISTNGLAELISKINNFQLYEIGKFTIGYMQSKYCHYSLSKLSRDAIKVNNNKIRKLSEDLIKSGRTILLYNTDGIWYTGDIYHGENEGPDLGQWRNDHTDCILRIKSAGAYEFIEDKVYHPVVRGYTNLDKLKDRSQWEWGDIFNATEVIYKLTKDGITNIKGDLF